MTLAEEQKIRYLTADYRLVLAAAALDGKAPSVFIRETSVAAAKVRLHYIDGFDGPPKARKKGKP